MSNERDSESPLPKCYLILFNITKKSNFGNLIRTANAFGAQEVIIVGKRAFRRFGAFEASQGTTTRHFYTLDSALEHLRELQCRICGVEILPAATPIHRHAFRGPTAFMVGNEGTGLSEQQVANCDEVVFVPQYGTAASLNVNVATAIVLHHFAIWAGFPQSERESAKFVAQQN